MSGKLLLISWAFSSKYITCQANCRLTTRTWIMIIYWRCWWLKSLLNAGVFCRLGGGGIIVGLKVWVKYVTLKAYLVHQVLQWQRTMIESLLVWSHLACPVQPLNNKHGKKKKKLKSFGRTELHICIGLYVCSAAMSTVTIALSAAESCYIYYII